MISASAARCAQGGSGVGLTSCGREGLLAADRAGDCRLADRPRAQDGFDRRGIIQVLFRHPVYRLRGDPADRFDALLGRRTSLDGQGLRPELGQSRDGVSGKLGLGDFPAFGRSHQFGRHAVLPVGGDDRLQPLEQRLAVPALGIGRRGEADRRHRRRLDIETGGQGRSLRHQGIQVPSLAVQDIRQHLAGGEIGAVIAGQPVGQHGHPVGQVGFHGDGRRLQGLQLGFRPGGTGREGMPSNS